VAIQAVYLRTKVPGTLRLGLSSTAFPRSFLTNLTSKCLLHFHDLFDQKFSLCFFFVPFVQSDVSIDCYIDPVFLDEGEELTDQGAFGVVLKGVYRPPDQDEQEVCFLDNLL